MYEQKRIILYNPAISSLNMGDHIIYDSIKSQMDRLFKDAFLVEVSTHLPVSRFIDYFGQANYRFVCGSNLLRGKMNRRFRQWDINGLYASRLGPCILIGVGWWQYGDSLNSYTKRLYHKVLATNFFHSVRDAYTEKQLIQAGFTNIINTSCPTMWSLTKEHCEKIPISKSKDVICTITDYKPDLIKDKELLRILLKNYENVYIWLQGFDDINYFHELDPDERRIKIIPSNLKSYDDILLRDIDYVGTRLHAGIRALQKGRRAVIIGIDNRALEKQKDFNLTCISRENLYQLELKINSDFHSDIRIPSEDIEKWKGQFIDLQN